MTATVIAEFPVPCLFGSSDLRSEAGDWEVVAYACLGICGAGIALVS